MRRLLESAVAVQSLLRYVGEQTHCRHGHPSVRVGIWVVGRDRGGDDIEPIEDISDPSQELCAAHPARGAVLIGDPFAGIE
jgi:hypothetical protein